MPSHLTSDALFAVLRLRARTAVPLSNGVRRLRIALASGARKEERLADLAWRKGDAKSAIVHWRALEKEQPLRAAWPLKIGQALKEGGDIEGAERTVVEARARGIEDERVARDILRYGRMWRRSNSTIEEAEAIIADPKAGPDKLFHTAFYLMSQNRFEPARAGFERIIAAGDKRHGDLARGSLAALARLEQNRAAGRPDIPGWLSPTQSSFVVREPSSDTLVVGFSLPEGTFGLSANALHAMLSDKGVNGLYLYDSRQLHHLDGTDRFGRGWQAMIDGIRAYASEIGARRIITMGGSATGYTAMRAAMDLDAAGALTFSPATMMRVDANPGLARGAYTVVRLRENVAPMMKLMRPLIQARPQGLRVEAYYGASNIRDIMHVAHLSGLAGVHTIPIEGYKQHNSLTEMSLRGYANLLDGFSDGAPGVS